MTDRNSRNRRAGFNLFSGGNRGGRFRLPIIPLISIGVILLPIFGYVVYTFFRIDVPAEHIAILIKKTGKDMTNGEEVAAGPEYKGLQLETLKEGRYFYNPYNWEWRVYPMVQIPKNKMGVRIRLYGDDLPYGQFVATKENQKGIVQEVLRPGRHPLLNAIVIQPGQDISRVSRGRYGYGGAKDYVEIIELHDPVVIPAGFKGVVTNLHGPVPEDPNTLLVDEGFRGVQKKTYDAGTYYENPYLKRIEKIDTRSQRFNLAENFDMGFPSKDGFWVSLDGRIEFAVMPEKASQVYVTYNDVLGDPGDKSKQGQQNESSIDKEIIRKIILPNARSFCRLHGSNSSGRDFIGGETRSAFEAAFQNAIRETCRAQGIEIVQAVITQIKPPETIAKPVRAREVARQMLKQYKQEKLQNDQEAILAKEKELVKQRSRLVGAERTVVELTTRAMKERDIKLEEANRDKQVAAQQLDAAKDQASAILAEKQAEAEVISFENEAVAAGWKASVKALGGGEAYAKYVLYKKMAPGFKSIMTNTANSPLMEIFKGFGENRSDEGNEPDKTED